MDERGALGRNVLHFRSVRKWSQQDLAGESALSLRYLAGIERGEENPSLATIVAISSALEIPAWALLHPSYDDFRREN
ncbi:helix-turn-helix domain-containing protein [Brevundimonas sp.]|uniref:helix-turn-helix domain-containing protein n=1 Tax=Brevundimonas sp. TaxID=1871086 RepID=UPI00391811DC